MSFQGGAQGCAGTMQTTANRAHGHVQEGRHVLVGQGLHLAQHQDLARVRLESALRRLRFTTSDDVQFADRNIEGADETASLVKQSRGSAEALPVDVADAESVDALWARVERTRSLISPAGYSNTPVSTTSRWPATDSS